MKRLLLILKAEWSGATEHSSLCRTKRGQKQRPDLYGVSIMKDEFALQTVITKVTSSLSTASLEKPKHCWKALCDYPYALWQRQIGLLIN